MANRLDGRWQLYGLPGTDYASWFQSAGNVATTVLSGDSTTFTVTYLDGRKIVYGGAGLSFDGTILSGAISSVTLVDGSAATVAEMTSTTDNPFLIDQGAAINDGQTFFDLLLSGDNLVVGAGTGSSGNVETLVGGAGFDTFQPANQFTELNDLSGNSGLDLSGVTGPATVSLLNQTFTLAGVTQNMVGVIDVTGTAQDDVITGGVDGTFTIAGGDGADTIDALGATTYGARYTVDAGAGDDIVNIDGRGWGTLDGGAGSNTLRGGGDIRFYNFENFDTFANTSNINFGGSVIFNTEQFKKLDHITNENVFNGGHIIFDVSNSGTVDFDRLLDPGLRVTVYLRSAGTSVIGSDGDDSFYDFSDGLTGGLPDRNFIAPLGGNDLITNQAGSYPYVFFTGALSDYTIGAVDFGGAFTITDTRAGSPDGEVTFNSFFDHDKPFLVFTDQVTTYHAAEGALPSPVAYNGILELFGPDNFDYEHMFPALKRATSATLDPGGTTYTVDYFGGKQVVFEGTGLTTASEFAPNGGIVDEITVIDTSIPGNPVTLAHFYSEPTSGHDMKVPFTTDVLNGGATFYHQLMFGNNHVDGSPNDDFIVADIGQNTIAAGEGFDTLYLPRKVDSYEYTRDADGNYTSVTYVDLIGDTYKILTPSDPIPGSHPAPAVLNAIADYVDSIPPSGQLPPISDPLVQALLHIAGDPHITTLDGVYYDFQLVGEFVAVHSTDPGQPLDIQIRTVPYPVVGIASGIQQVATEVDGHRVTFDRTRADPVWVDGAAVDFSSGPVAVADAVLSEVGYRTWLLEYASGEVLTIVGADVLNMSLDPGPNRVAGTLRGLAGNYDGDTSNDFQLADGSVLPRPLSTNIIHGVFGEAWRVEQASSLFDYGSGETTETYTSPIVPTELTLSDFPTDVIRMAEALVNEAGISDPGLRQAAIYDYLLSGDADFIESAAVLDESGVSTVEIEQNASPAAAPMLGVITVEAVVVEAPSGSATEVDFQVYRTGPAIGGVTVDWEVLAPGSGYFDATDFAGGVLPSGQVTFATGESTKTFTVTLPDGAVTLASEHLKVMISTADDVDVIGPSAQAEVVNNGPVSGDPAAPQFLKLAGPGSLTHTGNAWTLDLGAVDVNADLSGLRLAVVNAAGPDGNDLSGMFDESGGFADFTGNQTFLRLAAGGIKGGLGADIDTSTPGNLSSILTLHPAETNGTGFANTLGDVTLTVMAQIAAAPVPIAVDDAFATDEDTGFSGNVLDGSLSGGSPDTDPGNAPTVTAVNGNAAGLGHAIALPSGARLTLNGDGSFSYDPNGAFDDLPGPASGASNLTGTDSFTYELNGSDTATVTATVNGVDSNGDVLLGTAGADALDGGIGSNVASYANATGAVTANLANPAANTGAAAGDTYANIENLTGSNFADNLFGNANGNILEGRGGADRLDGGGGADTASYAGSTAGVNVQLQYGIAAGGHAAGDTLASIENLTGSNHNDTLVGNPGVNVLSGNGGNDILRGLSGADRLLGGAGDDWLYTDSLDTQVLGGIGIDRLIVVNGNAVTNAVGATGIEIAIGNTGNDIFDGTGSSADLTLRGLSGNDVLTGGSGDDYLYGHSDADELRGGGGLDRLFVDENDTVIDGGAGDLDRVIVQQLVSATTGVTIDMAASHVEIAYGNLNDDTFDGSGATVDLTLYGRNGQDTLTGGSGNDRLFGDNNNTAAGDVLDGGQGNDYLRGGSNGASGWAERDQFVFDADWGNDRIFDFADNGAEKIDFSAIAGIDERSDLTIADGAGYAMITYTDTGGWTGTIRVDGVTAAQLQDNDFIYI